MGMQHGTSALSTKDAGDWVQAHAELSWLASERAQLDAEEGRWLLCAWRSAAHVHLGYGSFVQYIERLFGYKPRTTQEKLRVAEALEALPGLARALESGALSWCATREVTRVAVPDTEAAWLDVARGKTLRELEARVASKAPGDAPDTPAGERPRSRVLRFEVAPDTFATFRESMLQLRRLAGANLDDDAVLLAMARHVLGGPRDDGRSSYQISLSVCSACRCGAQRADGKLVAVDSAIVEMAECDAQHLAELLPHTAELRAANENASAPADTTAGPEGGAHAGATVPSADGSDRVRHCPDHAHTGAPLRPGSDAVTDTPSLDASTPAETGTTRADAHPSARAKQSIPPALRRAVLTRDRRHCRVPGCTHATFVDVHHVQPRSEGGRNEASNLLVLCSAHHRAVHRGELLIGGGAATTFLHADGAAYGAPAAPRLVDAHAKVFSALRHLGFREGEVKAVLAELRGDAELGAASVEALLREALRRIRPVRR